MIYSLCLKANLVGCHDLQLTGGFDHYNRGYEFKFMCQACGHVDEITVNVKNIYDRRCPICRSLASFRAIIGYGRTHNQFGMPNLPDECTEMMLFDIVGAVPFDYKFGGGWEVKYYGKVFRGLDLSQSYISFPTIKYDFFDEGAQDRKYDIADVAIEYPIAMFFEVHQKEIFEAVVHE